MKKCLIGFIVVLTSLFSFSFSVNAKTVYNIDYSTIDNIINNDNEIKENIDSLFDYIDTIKDDYYVFSTYSHDTEKYRTYNLYLLDKSTNITNFYYNLNKNKVLWFTVDFENTNIFEFSYSENKYPNKNFNEVFNEFLSNVENEIGTNTFHIQNANSVPIENYDKFLLMLYTNIPGGHMATTSETDSWNLYYDLSINDELITGDKEILSYYDYLNDIYGVKLTKGYANDLSGRDLYNIEADFSSLSNVNFKYQYKINNGSWIDIDSEDLINDSNNLPVKFSYPAYSNLTFHFRVLDVNDDLLDEKSITITELEDHVYSEIISGSQYSQIEFDFDLPLNQETCTKTEISNTGSLETIEYICPMLDLYYSILNSDVNGLENSMSFGIPYIEKKHLEDTGSSSIEKTEIITLSEYISSFYEGNKVIDFDSNITSLKLIVPLDYLIGSYVNIYFSANTTFDVNLIERSSSSNYYGSVDITGKAGVLFVPKNVNNDFLATFNFNPSSIYGLQLRDTYESNFNILAYYSIGYCDYREYDSTIPIICNEGQGGYTVSFNFERDNVKQSIFVLNKNFPEQTKAIVQYDTRYFVPVVYDELWSRPSFEHPITGETVTPDDLIDFDEALNDQDYESFFDMFIDSFNYFKDSLVGIFDNVTYFFNSLPVSLKYFFMLIFTIILFIFLIRFIL